MKLLSKSLFLISLSLIAATAFAGGSQTSALITGLQAGQAITNGAGSFLIVFAANSVGSASCVGSSDKIYFAIDPTTAQGRAAISMALAAYSEGRTVTAVGAGTCNIYAEIEDLGYMMTTD